MPARIEKVEVALYGANNLDVKKREQAYKTGWANLRDWNIAQMAIIDTEMVEMGEVFLPYRVVGEGRTNYDIARNNQLLLS